MRGEIFRFHPLFSLYFNRFFRLKAKNELKKLKICIKKYKKFLKNPLTNGKYLL